MMKMNFYVAVSPHHKGHGGIFGIGVTASQAVSAMLDNIIPVEEPHRSREDEGGEVDLDPNDRRSAENFADNALYANEERFKQHQKLVKSGRVLMLPHGVTEISVDAIDGSVYWNLQDDATYLKFDGDGWVETEHRTDKPFPKEEAA
jgi:hypothetical protein